MILTFFLQYFNCFGEVIFSPLVYLKMKYMRGDNMTSPEQLKYWRKNVKIICWIFI